MLLIILILSPVNFSEMKTSFRILLFCLLISSKGFAQQTTWQTGLFSFFDNTEFGHSTIQIHQTMAGVCFAPEEWFKLDSVHSGFLSEAGIEYKHLGIYNTF
ncbi:MAG TPA: hypothetical protein DDW27_14835 [Bacteroidales bacterium]|nr:hypothetical protein [Bacteroidales bacterium]